MKTIRVLPALLIALTLSSGLAQAGDDSEAAILRAVRAWNDALSAHDLTTLASTYAERVRHYGKSGSRAQVVAQKKAALKAAPDFRQSIEHLAVERVDDAHARVTFDKGWTQAGKARSVKASVRLVLVAGRWMIEEESDVKTDALTAKAPPVKTSDEAIARADSLVRRRYGSSLCWSIGVEAEAPAHFDLVVREVHGGRCRGDPQTSPVLDRLRVLQSGEVQRYDVAEDRWDPYVP